jgi:sulfur-oxidizing protein SoxB
MERNGMTVSRRDLLQLGAATAAILGASGLTRALAQQRLTEAELLAFPDFGNVTLVHVTDLHAQLVPLHFREPSTNIGVGDARGQPPFLTGRAFLDSYRIPPGTAAAHALSDVEYDSLARAYGQVGGIDRVATVINAIRATRDANMLLLDGGDTFTNSYTSLQSKGGDMAEVMKLLKPDAMTGHWEFTLGAERVEEIIGDLGFPFLAQNVRDTEFEDEVFKPRAMFERGGVKVAVIGQALPYTAIANPRWMFPKWSFGIRERELQRQVDEARAEGAGLVVLLSHNGFAVDRKLAGRVRGIDVILVAHTHDALPEPVQVGQTLLVTSGSHGKFVSRLDLDVRDGRIQGFRYRLIPVFSEVIRPDPVMAAAVHRIRAPHAAHLSEQMATADATLFRRGTFNGTFDDVICDALLTERDAEIALSPGFRWGGTVLSGPVTREHVYNATAMSYPQAWRMPMTGARLKETLEDVADNIFNPDPYLQGGGDMVRLGGMTYAIDVTQPIGRRISEMRLVRSGEPIDMVRSYMVTGWASTAENVEGPAVWDVVFAYLAKNRDLRVRPRDTVRLVGG